MNMTSLPEIFPQHNEKVFMRTNFFRMVVADALRLHAGRGVAG
jgi:hypothetical protein